MGYWAHVRKRVLKELTKGAPQLYVLERFFLLKRTDTAVTAQGR